MQQLNEIIASFRKLEQETENRKAIAKLHQRAGNDQEESTTLEDLLEQEKRRRGL